MRVLKRVLLIDVFFSFFRSIFRVIVWLTHTYFGCLPMHGSSFQLNVALRLHSASARQCEALICLWGGTRLEAHH
jgi:hypothetical protein